MKLIAVISLILISQAAFAQSAKRGQYKSSKLGATTYNYTGSNYTSFANGSPAYGVEFSVDAGGSYLRYFFKARFNQSIGSQNFTRSGTVYFSKYEFYSVEPEIGFALYPVMRAERGLSMYLWGVANLNYDYLNIKQIPSTVSGVDAKQQAIGVGFGGGIGGDFILYTTKGGNRILIYGELGFRNTTAPLAGASSFEIGGMTTSVGFGF